MHGPFCLWVSVHVPGTSGKRQRPQVPRRARLRAALCFSGRLQGLAIWVSCPEAPAACGLALCMVLLLSGEIRAVSECFLKSCGCPSVVSGPGSAFELEVRSSLLLCSGVYMKRFLSKAMKLNVQNYL